MKRITEPQGNGTERSWTEGQQVEGTANQTANGNGTSNCRRKWWQATVEFFFSFFFLSLFLSFFLSFLLSFFLSFLLSFFFFPTRTEQQQNYGRRRAGGNAPLSDLEEGSSWRTAGDHRCRGGERRPQQGARAYRPQLRSLEGE